MRREEERGEERRRGKSSGERKYSKRLSFSLLY
jgi:hypothetical protein